MSAKCYTGARTEIGGVGESGATRAAEILSLGMRRVLSKIVHLCTWLLHGVALNTGHHRLLEDSQGSRPQFIQDSADGLPRAPLLHTSVRTLRNYSSRGSYGSSWKGGLSTLEGRTKYYRPLRVLHYGLQFVLLWPGHFKSIQRLLKAIHKRYPLLVGGH